MSARVEPDAANAAASQSLVPAVALGSAQAVAFDPDDRYSGNALPSDHPKWMNDTLSISQRARALFSQLKPVAMRVVTYWDHQVRSVVIGGRKVSVDLSGSYRLD